MHTMKLLYVIWSFIYLSHEKFITFISCFITLTPILLHFCYSLSNREKCHQLPAYFLLSPTQDSSSFLPRTAPTQKCFLAFYFTSWDSLSNEASIGSNSAEDDSKLLPLRLHQLNARIRRKYYHLVLHGAQDYSQGFVKVRQTLYWPNCISSQL